MKKRIFSVWIIVLTCMASAMCFSAEEGRNLYGWENYIYNFNEDGTLTIDFYYGNEGSISIPESIYDTQVTEIGETAFFNESGLTSVRIPDTVTTIGGGAFKKCTGLINVELPETVKSIGNDAFAMCSNVTLSVVKDTYAEQYARDNSLNTRTKMHMTGGKDNE